MASNKAKKSKDSREFNFNGFDKNLDPKMLGISIDMSMVQDDNSMVLGNNSFLDIKSGFDNTHAKEENRPMKREIVMTQVEQSQCIKTKEVSIVKSSKEVIQCKSQPKTEEKHSSPLPVFECIFCAKTDRAVALMIKSKLFEKQQNTIDNEVLISKFTKLNIHSKELTCNEHCENAIKTFNILTKCGQKEFKPILKYNCKPKPIKRVSKEDGFMIKQTKIIFEDGQKESLCANFGAEIMLNQSSCINIRNSTKPLRRRRDISYESAIHNIYNPEFSSSSENTQTSEFSSLEISFELNDSFEELKVIDCSKPQESNREKSVKINNLKNDSIDGKKSLEPLFCISPKKDLFIPNQNYIRNIVALSGECNSNFYYQNAVSMSCKNCECAKRQNESYEINKQSLYNPNEHFSSFSTAIDFTKSNHLRMMKQSSIDHNMRSSDIIDLTQENNTINSHRFGSDYETMLKTVNSLGSFNSSENYNNYNRSKELCHLDRGFKSTIFKGNNCSSIEPIYNGNTIILEKRNKSYYQNQSRISQASIPNQTFLSRESMNLTPQLLSPDTEQVSKQRPAAQQKNKVNMPVSRNSKNVLSKQRLTSANLSNFISGSFVSNPKKLNVEAKENKDHRKINNFQKFFPLGKFSTKTINNENKDINTANINKIKKTKIFGSNKFNPKCIKSKAGSIILKTKPDFKFVEFKKQHQNIVISNFIEPKEVIYGTKNKPKLSRCHSFVQKPTLKHTKVINSSNKNLFYQYLSKDVQMH